MGQMLVFSVLHWIHKTCRAGPGLGLRCPQRAKLGPTWAQVALSGAEREPKSEPSGNVGPMLVLFTVLQPGACGISFARSVAQWGHSTGNPAAKTRAIPKRALPGLGWNRIAKTIRFEAMWISAWAETATKLVQVGANLELSGSGSGFVCQCWPQTEPMLWSCRVEAVV